MLTNRQNFTKLMGIVNRTEISRKHSKMQTAKEKCLRKKKTRTKRSTIVQKYLMVITYKHLKKQIINFDYEWKRRNDN